jgi:cystathionine gamma-synthase
VDLLPLAMQGWQHVGMGISSRYAEHCLSLIPEEGIQPLPPTIIHLTRGHNGHHSANGPISFTDCKDESDFAERKGDKLAAAEKSTLRHRIAGLLMDNSPEYFPVEPCRTKQIVEVGLRSRGVKDVTESDVFLFPTGMCAIWNAYDLVRMTRPLAKSIYFGYVPGTLLA